MMRRRHPTRRSLQPCAKRLRLMQTKIQPRHPVDLPVRRYCGPGFGPITRALMAEGHLQLRLAASLPQDEFGPYDMGLDRSWEDEPGFYGR